MVRRKDEAASTPDDPAFERRLEDAGLTWGGDPLFLMMAGLKAAESGLSGLLALSRTDLAIDLAKREIERIKRIARAQGLHERLLAVLANLAPVAKQLLERGGFTVDMQSMDWQTLVSRRAKKEPPSEGGWNAFLTSWVAADVLNPISTAGLAAVIDTVRRLKANCDEAWFGWVCDEELEALRDRFARSTDPDEQAELAEQIQVRALEVGTHGYVGQWYEAMAYRNTISGVVDGPAPFLWNIKKEG